MNIFRRTPQRKKAPAPARLIAYDFETTRIQPGTPRPLYLTAYSQDPPMHYASAIGDMTELTLILVNQFLTPENAGCKFVAWNGNKFDGYLIAVCLIHREEYTVRPYLTRSNALRGLRVELKECPEWWTGKGNPSWEFLDGMAMLGFVGLSLEKFLLNFAPDYGKMIGVIDFEREEFNPDNPTHCDYAMRDSVGLYHGMMRAQEIIVDAFDEPLRVTMGGVCIRIFAAHIPEGVFIHEPPEVLTDTIRQYVMRGGFCYLARRYVGPVWKYDINQAYAAAMREAKLPTGRAMHTACGLHTYADVYVARVTATNPRGIIPFYYRTEIDGRLRSVFSATRIADTWLTSIEVEQLRAEGWQISIAESWTWETRFNMRDYVDKLERIRTTCDGGPSGPIGTMAKAVGNHSYGKTVEQLDDIEFTLAAQCPPGFAPFYADGFEPLPHVFFRFLEGDDKPRPKPYHKPQIGAFITAHVRMVLRRAALVAPDAWIYADTDCVVFTRDVTAALDVDAKRYGAWKIECAGKPYRFIAKKVYAEIDGPNRSAKGMNVKRLTAQDFEAWADGSPPVQDQTQRQNFLRVMQGAEMFRSQTRRGTKISA